MIISASRRTDIPAFYSQWFLNRIREGFVLVRNPMNYHQISRIDLSPELIDGIVFWTKNPLPMLGRLNELTDYMYYFQFTVTPYDTDIEPWVPSKKEVILPAFRALSKAIGPERVIWRYDPILLNHRYTISRHIEAFSSMAQALHGYTQKCMISFVDSYRNTRRHKNTLSLEPIGPDEMAAIAQSFSSIAQKYHIALATCAEDADLTAWGISHGCCIDRTLFEKLLGRSLRLKKDPHQRGACGCAASVDIGVYNSCRHLCRYCYANYNEPLASQNASLHNPDAPLLIGTVRDGDRVYERKR